MLKILLKCPNKFVSTEYIRQQLQPESRIVTFGLNTGSVEMDFFQKGYDITFYCNRYWMYEFWKCLSNSPDALISAVKYFHDNFSQSEIMYHKDKWYEHFDDPYERAGIYYLLNRYSENGQLYSSHLTKDNFSILNLLFLERHAHAAKNLKLFYIEDEQLVSKFDQLKEHSIIFLPMGKFKRDFIVKKNTHSISTPHYEPAELKKYLTGNSRKMILLYKYDKYVDEYYQHNKTYINKLGFATRKPELAEDLIVSNF